MDNLVCTSCRTTYYSAAARTMVERGERCDCGAALELREGVPHAITVGGTPEGRSPINPPRGRRRFGRG
jgi:hypothetical protein